MTKVASDFEKMINADRSRKKNEALAAKIFGKDRRASAPAKGSGGAGGTLTSRAGIKKRVSSQATRPPAGNINGEWTHDLHSAADGPRAGAGAGAAAARRPPTGPSGSLASRISVPGAIAPSQRRQRRAAQVAQALIKTELQPATPKQTNTISASLTAAGGNRGLTIRGLAGPFVVMAQNFAPGTTAADIESAVTPVGGIVSNCRLMKTQPIVIAEVVFESREGAERVIETFNNQVADGRVLHVYPKVGGAVPPVAAPPSGPKAQQTSNNVVDGSEGFDDPMEVDRQKGPGSGRLYSDNIVGGGGTSTQNRRGRGFQLRGGRGGGGR